MDNSSEAKRRRIHQLDNNADVLQMLRSTLLFHQQQLKNCVPGLSYSSATSSTDEQVQAGLVSSSSGLASCNQNARSSTCRVVICDPDIKEFADIVVEQLLRERIQADVLLLPPGANISTALSELSKSCSVAVVISEENVLSATMSVLVFDGDMQERRNILVEEGIQFIVSECKANTSLNRYEDHDVKRKLTKTHDEASPRINLTSSSTLWQSSSLSATGVPNSYPPGAKLPTSIHCATCSSFPVSQLLATQAMLSFSSLPTYSNLDHSLPILNSIASQSRMSTVARVEHNLPATASVLSTSTFTRPDSETCQLLDDLKEGRFLTLRQLDQIAACIQRRRSEIIGSDETVTNLPCNQAVTKMPLKMETEEVMDTVSTRGGSVKSKEDLERMIYTVLKGELSSEGGIQTPNVLNAALSLLPKLVDKVKKVDSSSTKNVNSGVASMSNSSCSFGNNSNNADGLNVRCFADDSKLTSSVYSNQRIGKSAGGEVSAKSNNLVVAETRFINKLSPDKGARLLSQPPNVGKGTGLLGDCPLEFQAADSGPTSTENSGIVFSSDVSSNFEQNVSRAGDSSDKVAKYNSLEQIKSSGSIHMGLTFSGNGEIKKSKVIELNMKPISGQMRSNFDIEFSNKAMETKETVRSDSYANSTANSFSSVVSTDKGQCVSASRNRPALLETPKSNQGSTDLHSDPKNSLSSPRDVNPTSSIHPTSVFEHSNCSDPGKCFPPSFAGISTEGQRLAELSIRCRMPLEGQAHLGLPDYPGRPNQGPEPLRSSVGAIHEHGPFPGGMANQDPGVIRPGMLPGMIIRGPREFKQRMSPDVPNEGLRPFSPPMRPGLINEYPGAGPGRLERPIHPFVPNSKSRQFAPRFGPGLADFGPRPTDQRPGMPNCGPRSIDQRPGRPNCGPRPIDKRPGMPNCGPRPIDQRPGMPNCRPRLANQHPGMPNCVQRLTDPDPAFQRPTTGFFRFPRQPALLQNPGTFGNPR